MFACDYECTSEVIGVYDNLSLNILLVSPNPYLIYPVIKQMIYICLDEKKYKSTEKLYYYSFHDNILVLSVLYWYTLLLYLQ